MSSAALLLLLGLGQLPGSPSSALPDPAALVLELGAPRFAERQAASEALERLGASSLPSLRLALDSRDMEVKTRARSLLLKIETALLTQPTSVRMKFDGQALSEVVESLSQQTGFKIALYPQNLPRWRNQRVTLRSPQLLTFWKAVDELCDAASLQYNPNMQGFAGHQDQVFALTEGVIRTVTPVFDEGPFRVRLLGLDYHRNVSYMPGGGDLAQVPQPPRPAARGGPPRVPGAAGRPNPITNEQFTAQLLVTAEPRLSLAPRGEIRLIDAADDRGNSLVPTGRRGQSLNYTGYFGAPHGPVMESHAQLKRPIDPGETIKKLRGTIPVTVSARRANPLLVPLEKSIGKTFQNADVQLTVHSIRTMPDARHTILELSIRPNRADPLAGGDQEGYSSIFQRAQNQQLQLDVLDSRDQLMSWFQTSPDNENPHITITLTSPIQTAPPKLLRYYSVTRNDVDIPFEFAGMPMP